MPMIQGGNQPLVIQFDAAVDTLPQLVVSLWHDANCQPLKVWYKADMSIDDDTAVCPISEAETAKLPPQRLIIEAKGLDENGNTVFWDQYPIETLHRRDRVIKLTQAG